MAQTSLLFVCPQSKITGKRINCVTCFPKVIRLNVCDREMVTVSNDVDVNGLIPSISLFNNCTHLKTVIQYHDIGDKNAIKHVILRLESFTLAASRKYLKGCMVVGIDPEKEARLTALNKKVIKGS